MSSSHSHEAPEIACGTDAWYKIATSNWSNAANEAKDISTAIGYGYPSVYVLPNITPTCSFDPKTNAFFINPLFLDPDATKETFTFNGDGRVSQVARGAMIHEVAHALFSKFSLAQAHSLHQNVSQVIVALEELRVEYNMFQHLGRSKSLTNYVTDLKAGGLFIAGFSVPQGGMTPLDISICLALSYGRHDIGAISGEAAATMVDVYEAILGEELFDSLRDIWLRYLGLTDNDIDRRIELAKEWLDLLDMPSGNEKGQPDGSEDECAACKAEKEGGGAEGDSDGDGEKEGSGEGSEGEGGSEGPSSGPDGHSCKGQTSEGDGDKIREAINDAYEVTETDILGENRNRLLEARKAWMKSSEARKARRDNAAEETFGKGHGYVGSTVAHASRLYRIPTEPTNDERKAAVALAQELDRVSYVDKRVTRANSLIPPGRLRAAAAVNSAAVKSQGLIDTTEPWKQRRRKAIPKTPLTVGIIADVSGSMGSSVESVSTAAWMLSEAVNRVQGRTSTVLMGDTAYGLIKPGERMLQVPRYNAAFGFEAYKDSFDAIDGSLNLTGGRGARILFNVTDSQFVSSEHEKYAWQAMKECRQQGVQVFWLDFDGYAGGRYKNYGYGEVLSMTGSHIDNARLIGRTVVRAFESVKNR